MKGSLSKTQNERLRKVEDVDVGASCACGAGDLFVLVLVWQGVPLERLGKNVTRIALGDEVKRTGEAGRNDEKTDRVVGFKSTGWRVEKRQDDGGKKEEPCQCCVVRGAVIKMSDGGGSGQALADRRKPLSRCRVGLGRRQACQGGNGQERCKTGVRGRQAARVQGPGPGSVQARHTPTVTLDGRQGYLGLRCHLLRFDSAHAMNTRRVQVPMLSPRLVT